VTWRDLAACRGMDINLFFSERGDWHSVQAAKAACAACPVREQCLAEAIEEDEHSGHGIRGGVGPKVRQKMRAAAGGRKGWTPITHGTDHGYKLHKRRGSEACEACRQAHARYTAEYKARKRGAA